MKDNDVRFESGVCADADSDLAVGVTQVQMVTCVSDIVSLIVQHRLMPLP